MALGAPSPVEHPGRNLQEAVCLRTVQSAAEKHAIGLLDDRVNPHLVRKPGMMGVQNLTPDGLMGVLKPCCIMAAARIRALTAAHRIKPTSTNRHSAWRPNPGRGSTYRRGTSVQTTGTSSVCPSKGAVISTISNSQTARLEGCHTSAFPRRDAPGSCIGFAL